MKNEGTGALMRNLNKIVSSFCIFPSSFAFQSITAAKRRPRVLTWSVPKPNSAITAS
jgi:hypothetical protein